MILIKLTGGLGNQMFQYAHGRALSIKKKESLYLDTSWYKGRTDRTYILDQFNIETKQAGLFQKLFTKPITGDFQGEKYFKDAEKIIRKEFTLKNPPSPVSDPNSVSIHLRGGDYARGKKSDFHGTCSPEYYQKAVDLIRIKVPSPHFYIFSDDLQWAKNHIKFPEPFTVMSGAPSDSLFLMSSCKHHIIANSTFSWWAAWLNPDYKKIVIAPKKWFNDETMPSGDIIPPGWTQL